MIVMAHGANVNRLRILGTAAVILCSGCSEKSPLPPARLADEAAAETPPSAAVAASLDLQKPERLQIRQCHAVLGEFSGRFTLTIATHESLAPETLPALLIRVHVPPEKAKNLAGAALKGILFLQTDAANPIWRTATNQPVDVRITKADEQTIEGEVTGGLLTATGDQTESPAEGRFTARLRATAAKPAKVVDTGS
jgi:hypothetical protein